MRSEHFNSPVLGLSIFHTIFTDTNLLDWSEKNLIAVALQKSTYIWNAESKDCQRIEIFFPSPSSFYISSLCWSPHDKVLAIADNSGDITVHYNNNNSFCMHIVLK